MDPKKTKDLQIFNQNMHKLLLQENLFHQELVEIEEALKDIPNSEKNYRIVGKLMISQNKDDLIKRLKNSKESLSSNITDLNKQKESLKMSILKLQDE